MEFITSYLFNLVLFCMMVLSFVVGYLLPYLNKTPVGKLSSLSVAGRDIAWVISGVFVVRFFIVDLFHVLSGSMLPTLQINDKLLVSKYSYNWRNPITNTPFMDFNPPRRNDIALFNSPVNPDDVYVKRVYAVPGDRITIKNGYVQVWQGCGAKWYPVNKMLTSSLEQIADAVHDVAKLEGPLKPGGFFELTQNRSSWIVPDNAYLMVGDNRNNSFDGRFFGYVHADQFIGRVEKVLVQFTYTDGSGWLPAGLINGFTSRLAVSPDREFDTESSDFNMLERSSGITECPKN